MQPVNGVKERRLDLDVLRIVATFAVVVIHCTVYGNYGDVHSKSWWAAIVLNSLCRWSVPVFFMLSGAMLLDYRARYSTGVFYRKRLTKVVVPFLVWTVFYLVWGARAGWHELGSARHLYAHTIGAPASFHLWFFYPLFGLYLVTPILAVLTTQKHRGLVYGLIALCFLQNTILPLSLRFLGMGTATAFAIPLASPFLGYYLLGWGLKDAVPSRLSLGLVSLAGILGVCFTVITSYWLSVGRAMPDLYFMQYESVATYASAIAVFLLARAVPWRRVMSTSRSRAAVATVAGTCFGVYLVHIVMREAFTRWSGLPESSVLYMTVGATIVYVASVAVVVLMQHTPLVRRIVPG